MNEEMKKVLANVQQILGKLQLDNAVLSAALQDERESNAKLQAENYRLMGKLYPNQSENGDDSPQDEPENSPKSKK